MSHTPLYATPYGRKTGELLTAAMDCYTMHQNNPVYAAAPELLEVLEAMYDEFYFEGYDPSGPLGKAFDAIQKAKGVR